MKRRNTEPYVRLTRPLVRDAGVLRPATWEEALDRAAAGIRRTLDAKGRMVGIISIRDLTSWAVAEMTGGHELPDLEGSSATLTAAVEAERTP